LQDLVNLNAPKILNIENKSDYSSSAKQPVKKGDVKIEPPESNTKWWEISDEKVGAVNWTAVMSKRREVYILFYERMA
jgi:hypothetical protein